MSSPRTRRGGRVVGITAAIASTMLVSPVLAVSLGLGVIVLRRTRAWRGARRMNAAVERAAPEAYDLFATLLRAGLTPALACHEAARYTPAEMRAAFAELDLHRLSGERFADGLDRLGRSVPALRPLADTLARAERYGDPLGPIIDRLADEARQRRRRAAEISARQLPVRLCFPLVCCTLPAFVLLTIVPMLAGALLSLRQTL